MKRTTFQSLGAAGLLALFSQGAHAAPISSFNFETFGGFIDGTAVCDDGTTDCNLNFTNPADTFDAGDPANQFLDLNWGDPANPQNAQSGLRVEHVAGSIETDGGFVVVDNYFHDNFILETAGGYMEQVDFFSRFVLEDPDGDNLTPGLAGTQRINFFETPNQEPCEFGNPTDGPPCDDIFELNPLPPALTFGIGDWLYTLSFDFLADDDAVVQDEGVFSGEEGQVSVFTAEETTSQLQVRARVDATQIPAPGTMALMGLALAGLGLVTRRRSFQ